MSSILPTSLVLAICLSAGSVRAQLVIDDFEVGPLAIVGPINNTQQLLPPANVIGGQRRTFLRNATQNATLDLTGGDDAITFTQTDLGDFFLEWVVNGDLTAGGSLDRIEIDIEALSAPTILALFVNGHPTDTILNVAGPGTHVFVYADLPGPVDNVQDIRLTSQFDVGGGTMTISGIFAVPEPPGAAGEMASGITLAILVALRRRAREGRTPIRRGFSSCRA